MAKRLDKWEAQHRRNVERYARMIDDIYREAVREAAALTIPLSGVFSPDKPFSFSDYPITRQRIGKLLESLKNGVEVAVVNGVRSEWTLANNKNDELCRHVFGDNVGKLTQEQYRRYYSNNDKARDAFIARKTAGLDLSDRVWNYTDQFKTEIEMALDLGLRDRLSADEMSRTLRQYLKYPDKLFRRVRDEHGVLQLSKSARAFHPGQGVYRSSYKNARRLAATETNIAYRTADYVRHQQMDFVVGIEVHLSNNHTLNGKPFEDICDELAGKYPKDFKFTGWHPLCRCFTTTILKTPEEMAEDTRRIMAGEEPLPASESRNYVPNVPEKFDNWIGKNMERAERAKSLPYFMRDNEKYIRPMTITPQARAGADEALALGAVMMADAGQASQATLNIEQIRAAVDRGLETRTSPLLMLGEDIYKDSRIAIQNRIISDYMKGYAAKSDVVYMLGGATANGKSTLVESGLLPHPKGALVIDSDKVKAMIPEYRAMLASKDPLLVKKAASFVHEESSEIGKQIQKRAMGGGLATVFDGINNVSAEKVAGKVAKLRQQSGGKRIRADYVSLDTELSFKLAEVRAKKTGRKVPLDVITDSNRGVSAMMPEVIERKLFDELYLWDTNMNGKPRLILRQIDGVLTIEDKELYEHFLKKAKE